MIFSLIHMFVIDSFIFFSLSPVISSGLADISLNPVHMVMLVC